MVLNINDDDDDDEHGGEGEEVEIWMLKESIKTRGINESRRIWEIYDEERARINLCILLIVGLRSEIEMS